jgi:NAD(P)H-hydrate epimerase
MSALPQLPHRQPDSHKGTYGRALLIGGSRGMTGAIALSGMAALRGGAGLVTLAVPESLLDVVAGYDPCYMTVPLPEHDVRPGQICAPARTPIERLADKSTCVGYGPGIGRGEGLDLLVAWLYEHLSQPLVIDADGLNGLANRPEGLAHPGGPRILTPHPGEFLRLVGEARFDRAQAEEQAAALARENKIVIVLKGNRTFVTDGEQQHHNETGNPGLASGGTGDVLTGLITAIVCQGLSAFDAAQLGVHLHGLAGDLAAEQLGQVGMIASDVVRFLPAALQRIAVQ